MSSQRFPSALMRLSPSSLKRALVRSFSANHVVIVTEVRRPSPPDAATEAKYRSFIPFRQFGRLGYLKGKLHRVSVDPRTGETVASYDFLHRDHQTGVRYSHRFVYAVRNGIPTEIRFLSTKAF